MAEVSKSEKHADTFNLTDTDCYFSLAIDFSYVQHRRFSQPTTKRWRFQSLSSISQIVQNILYNTGK